MNKFLPDGVVAKLEPKAKGYEGSGKIKVEVNDTQTDDDFEILFEYVEDIDEILATVIFTPHSEGNTESVWITRSTTWEELGDELASKI